MITGTVQKLKEIINDIVYSTKVTDVHTHLFTTDFKDKLLWGIDDILTYSYLVEETIHWVDMPYEKFWAMTKKEQADLVWDTLFIKNSPISEACRGVLTIINELGIDITSRNIDVIREYFKNITVDSQIDKVLELANIEYIVMTNDPFDDYQREIWLKNYKGDERFKAVLRLDSILKNWEINYLDLIKMGYEVEVEITEKTIDEIKRFLVDWIDKMNAVYMSVSLPPTFIMPEDSVRSKIIENCIIPVSYEKNVPFVIMLGSKRQINPQLRESGDGVGKTDIKAIEYLCSKYSKNKFMVTMLSRENQHELCVIAKKFRNLLIFGCWWYLNNPSMIDEITRMRIELLGAGTVLQHSDATVFEQLIYKWNHSRKIIADVLFEKYSDIIDEGWTLQEDEIKRDVSKLLGGNFWDFLQRKF